MKVVTIIKSKNLKVEHFFGNVKKYVLKET